MATRVERIGAANLKITAKLNQLKSEIGAMSGLSTADKSSLVAAINEVRGVALAAQSSGGAAIDDNTTSTLTTWSSTKVNSEILAKIATALEGEDLSDLAQEIADLQLADAGLVSTSNPQSFTNPQQAQARENISAADSVEVGDTDYDFEADIDAALTF